MHTGRYLLSAALLGLSACAHNSERLDRVAISPRAEADPWEKSNRKLYAFSMALDRNLLLPVTNGYRAVMPEAPRRGIGNLYAFMREPTYFANAVLQGKPNSAAHTLGRILVNGVLGLGLADHATDMGLGSQPHDFGQTMAVWGVSSGPYVFTPLLGPNTVRDTFGFLVDFLFDPADLVKSRIFTLPQRRAILAGRVIDFRSELRDKGEQLLIGAADPYATTRAAWLQMRRYDIFDGNPPAAPDDDETAQAVLPADSATAPASAGVAATPPAPADAVVAAPVTEEHP